MFPGFFPLLVHAGLETGLVEGKAVLFDDVGGQIDREAEGVVELEDGLSGEDRLPGGAQLGDFLLEDAQAVVEGLDETFLLVLHHPGDELLTGGLLGVGPGHRLEDEDRGLEQDRPLETEHLGVAHGAAHDPPQHVAASLVGRQHPVGDEKGGGPAVVGDDPHRHVVVGGGAVGLAGKLFDVGDDPPQQVGVVVGGDPLHHGADPLQAHAGVDRGFRQRGQGAVLGAVELHEDVVPDLHVAVAVAADGALGAAAADLGSVVPEDLGAWAAGAGIAHRPEIVLLAEAEDALLRHSFLLAPDGGGLVVVVIDGDVEAALVELQIDGEKLPGEGDRLLLEVVAEGEVAEHLEEGVVAGGPADVFQVVMLAAGAHAFLRRGGPHVAALFVAEETVLELVHAGVGEEQRRIVVGDQ